MAARFNAAARSEEKDWGVSLSSVEQRQHTRDLCPALDARLRCRHRHGDIDSAAKVLWHEYRASRRLRWRAKLEEP